VVQPNLGRRPAHVLVSATILFHKPDTPQVDHRQAADRCHWGCRITKHPNDGSTTCEGRWGCKRLPPASAAAGHKVSLVAELVPAKKEKYCAAFRNSSRSASSSAFRSADGSLGFTRPPPCRWCRHQKAESRYHWPAGRSIESSCAIRHISRTRRACSGGYHLDDITMNTICVVARTCGCILMTLLCTDNMVRTYSVHPALSTPVKARGNSGSSTRWASSMNTAQRDNTTHTHTHACFRGAASAEARKPRRDGCQNEHRGIDPY